MIKADHVPDEGAADLCLDLLDTLEFIQGFRKNGLEITVIHLTPSKKKKLSRTTCKACQCMRAAVVKHERPPLT